jgi:hypothetical protein
VVGRVIERELTLRSGSERGDWENTLRQGSFALKETPIANHELCEIAGAKRFIADGLYESGPQPFAYVAEVNNVAGNGFPKGIPDSTAEAGPQPIVIFL